jgi:LmbE family N-acetylglucosaminyl deacetylase
MQIAPLMPASFFEGRTLVLVPHMDDAVLGCGGTLATLKRADVKLVYCTDGRGTMAQKERATLINTKADIGLIRKRETLAALATLGYAEEQAVFLPFQEWKLGQAREELRRALEEIISAFEPACILAPSRYDKHVDHVALNRVAQDILHSHTAALELLEYFVYYQWKLLPAGDIRAYIRSERLLRMEIGDVSPLKRQALDQFVSQVTLYYAWQHKPVLSDALLTEFATGPELFMHAKRHLAERDILTIPPVIVRLLNRLEPILKNTKEKLLRLVFNLRRARRAA